MIALRWLVVLMFVLVLAMGVSEQEELSEQLSQEYGFADAQLDGGVRLVGNSLTSPEGVALNVDDMQGMGVESTPGGFIVTGSSGAQTINVNIDGNMRSVVIGSGERVEILQENSGSRIVGRARIPIAGGEYTGEDVRLDGEEVGLESGVYQAENVGLEADEIELRLERVTITDRIEEFTIYDGIEREAQDLAARYVADGGLLLYGEGDSFRVVADRDSVRLRNVEGLFFEGSDPQGQFGEFVIRHAPTQIDRQLGSRGAQVEYVISTGPIVGRISKSLDEKGAVGFVGVDVSDLSERIFN